MCSQIDRHNRWRQDPLQLEKTLIVKTWSVHVNSSLLAVTIGFVCLLCKFGHGAPLSMCKSAFCERLAEGLIDYRYDAIKRRSWDSSGEIELSGDDEPASGIRTHLAETN